MFSLKLYIEKERERERRKTRERDEIKGWFGSQQETHVLVFLF